MELLAEGWGPDVPCDNARIFSQAIDARFVSPTRRRSLLSDGPRRSRLPLELRIRVMLMNEWWALAFRAPLAAALARLVWCRGVERR